MSNRVSIPSFADFLKNNPLPMDAINSAQVAAEHIKARRSEYEMLRDSMNRQAECEMWQTEGAKANIETRDKLIEQNELLRKQLTEQTEIHQRLEHEFKMGAREAVITRRIAYWSLGVGIVGVIIAIISLFRG
ncbi:MAG: hypothetical protein E7044_10810 [Lentisphaerae bacterium]|nr:hypothetical protein [Lentisphaerota bacterium]